MTPSHARPEATGKCRAYYNEIDPSAAAWLRELIKRGEIAPGDVDERSIEDVCPADLLGYTQCHFFAGIGVWSYALRLAGWPDDRPVWTGSCPCQPFSTAGQGKGFADERHLWPAFFHLIEVCGPERVFGEQVAGKDGLGWLDLVQADLEAVGYACGAVPFPAAGIGAPHIRERLYWVADRNDAGLEGWGKPERERSPEWASGASGLVSGLADATSLGRIWRRASETCVKPRSQQRPNGFCDAGGVADLACSGWREERQDGRGGAVGDRAEGISARLGAGGSDLRSSPLHGFWGDADWLFCRDGKWRPAEPGIQQMADGSAPSLGRLCDSSIKEVEDEIEAWSQRHQIDGTQAVRDLWDILSQDEVVERKDGRFDSVQEAPFLLSFVRQLSNQGWKFPVGDERAGAETSRKLLRILRWHREPDYSSRGRGLDEQLAGEPSDPLRLLSQILAHHTEIAWGKTSWKNAAAFPLAELEPARVGRLRGYGNGLVAPQAQAFIESYIEVRAA